MARRKAFPLRINEDILSAMQGWADDELRSVNAQIEYVLRQSLRQAGRVKKPGPLDPVDLPEEPPKESLEESPGKSSGKTPENKSPENK